MPGVLIPLLVPGELMWRYLMARSLGVSMLEIVVESSRRQPMTMAEESVPGQLMPGRMVPIRFEKALT